MTGAAAYWLILLRAGFSGNVVGFRLPVLRASAWLSWLSSRGGGHFYVAFTFASVTAEETQVLPQLVFSRTALAAYGSFQARGRIRAVAASLHQSHSNSGSKPCLQPIPQLTATLDPQPTEQGQGSNPQPHGS